MVYTYSSSFRQTPNVGDSAASVYDMICFAINNNEIEKQQQTTEHKWFRLVDKTLFPISAKRLNVAGKIFQTEVLRLIGRMP